jgi:acetyl-CoA C-acetyltransferase
MQKVAVVGVGETKFSGAQTRSNLELFSQAAMDAINEANLKPGDIQAVLVGNALAGFEEKQQMVQAFITEDVGAFNVPTNVYDGACASSGVVIHDAFIWIASGLYDIVLAGGTDRAATMGTSYGTKTYSMYSDRYYEYPSGITFPVSLLC